MRFRLGLKGEPRYGALALMLFHKRVTVRDARADTEVCPYINPGRELS